jgi:hypothetical protein
LEEFDSKQGRVGDAFEVGQGTCRAVEPVMMMMMISSTPDIMVIL